MPAVVRIGDELSTGHGCTGTTTIASSSQGVNNVYANNKLIDVGFSGILQNHNLNANQSDVRLRIMSRIFYCLFDVPIVKKRMYKEKKIYWNSISPNKIGLYLSIFIGKRKYLSDKEYSDLIKSSKIVINTLSPMGLISPRFFEAMASGSLVFCEDSNLYNNIFPNNCYVTFKNDLNDFDEKLFYYLNHVEERNKFIEKAYSEVHKKHTWQIRVNDLLNTIKNAKFV